MWWVCVSLLPSCTCLNPTRRRKTKSPKNKYIALKPLRSAEILSFSPPRFSCTDTAVDINTSYVTSNWLLILTVCFQSQSSESGEPGLLMVLVSACSGFHHPSAHYGCRPLLIHVSADMMMMVEMVPSKRRRFFAGNDADPDHTCCTTVNNLQDRTSVSGQRSIRKKPVVFSEPTESIHPAVLGCSCCQQQAVLVPLPSLLCTQTYPLVYGKCPNTSGIIFSICLCTGARLVCFINATTVKSAPSTWRQLAAVSK